MTAKKQSGGKMAGGIISLVIVAVILVALNIIAGNLRIRKDMTEEKLYSLSDGTKTILRDLESDITLKLFFNSGTPEMPILFKDFAQRLEDLLEEYCLESNGKLTLEKYDPQPDSDDEETAQSYGIPGQPMGMVGPAIYMGLVAVSGDVEASIPFIDPRGENLVEYHITRLINRLEHPEKPEIGIMSTLPVLGSSMPNFMMPQGQISQKPWTSFQELKTEADLLDIPLDTKLIDGELAALILVHPKGLSQQTLLAIDQYVLDGGKLLVLLDPFAITEIENSPTMTLGQPPSPSDLPGLLSAWNVNYNPGMLAADQAAATRVNAGGGRVQENAMWMLFRSENINREDILTAELETVMQPFAGTFDVLERDGATVTPLITTSEESCKVSAATAQFGPDMLRREFKRGGVGLHTAVRISGKFKTAFPSGIEVTEETAGSGEEEAEPKTETIMPRLTEGESTVVLIGDTDMFADRFCVRPLNFLGFQGYEPINDNLSLLVNIVDQLAGSSALIGIRSRGKVERPFKKVLAMEQKARIEWQSREMELQSKLQETRQQLNDLQAKKDPNQKLILSQEQREAIATFRKQEAETSKKLKAVRKSLRREIDQLGLILKVLNIAAVPLLVGLAGIAYGVYRKTAK